MLALLFTQVPLSAAPALLELVLEPSTNAPRFRNGAAFFTAGPHGFNNNHTLMPPLLSDLQRLGATALLDWDGVGRALRTEPLVDTVTTPRLLGGWSVGKNVQQQGWSDLAFRTSDGSLAYRWELLWSRLDPMVNNSIHPIVVLDNVDYAFCANASDGKYGQSLAPDNNSIYALFIAKLVTLAMQRYGRVATESFWWRIATEPNTGRGGTGQDIPAPQALKISTYVDYYVAVHSAIRSVLPTAVVGPGNFASWWQRGMACNGTTGKHANEGLDLIAPMLTGILDHGGTIGFLAMSFYASDAGNAIESISKCAAFAGCGYDPRQARVAGEGLRYLRGLDPALADVPLQVHEYTQMLNGHGRGPSFEPGAFGAAWTLASCIEFAAQGIERVFHWNIGAGVGGYDSTRYAIDAAGHVLYFGNAWVMAAARKLFGGSKEATVSVLEVVGGDADDRTLARRRRHRAGSSDGGGVCANTTASGIGGLLSSSGGGIGLLLNVFSQRKDCNASVTVSVAFQCTACESATKTSSPRVQVMILNHTTSVFDQILRHASISDLAYPGDGEVYPLDIMLTAEGFAGVKAKSAHWLAMQEAVFTQRDVDAVGDGVNVTCDGGGACTLEVTGASPPSTYAVWVG